MATGKPMQRILDWDEVTNLVNDLLDSIPAGQFDLLLVVTRGGMVPACLISELAGLRNIVVAAVQFHTRDGTPLEGPRFFQFPDDELLRDQRILVIDDVWDSGNTAVTVKRRIIQAGGSASVAVLHYKPRASEFPEDCPDYFARSTEDWIVYPWDSFS